MLSAADAFVLQPSPGKLMVNRKPGRVRRSSPGGANNGCQDHSIVPPAASLTIVSGHGGRSKSLSEAFERRSFARRCVLGEYRPATNLHIRRCRPTASPVTIRSMSFLGGLTSGKERFSAAKIMHSCRYTRGNLVRLRRNLPPRGRWSLSFLAALERRRERGVSLRSRRQWWLRPSIPARCALLVKVRF